MRVYNHMDIFSIEFIISQQITPNDRPYDPYCGFPKEEPKFLFDGQFTMLITHVEFDRQDAKKMLIECDCGCKRPEFFNMKKRGTVYEFRNIINSDVSIINSTNFAVNNSFITNFQSDIKIAANKMEPWKPSLVDTYEDEFDCKEYWYDDDTYLKKNYVITAFYADKQDIKLDIVNIINRFIDETIAQMSASKDYTIDKKVVFYPSQFPINILSDSGQNDLLLAVEKFVNGREIEPCWYEEEI